MMTLRFVKAPPGKRAQAVMASAARRVTMMEETPAHAIDAAVLVLLTPACEKKNEQCLLEWNVLLIRRNVYPGAHSGQISFPGGRCEKNDTDLWKTACRETFEELGIPANHLEMVGPLTNFYIPLSNYLIHPFVAARTATAGEIITNPREVVDYKKIPIKVFDPQKAIQFDVDHQDGTKRSAPAWLYEDYVIWGATAMILAELYLSIREETLILGKGVSHCF